jgi:hypothetical protein
MSPPPASKVAALCASAAHHRRAREVCGRKDGGLLAEGTVVQTQKSAPGRSALYVKAGKADAEKSA